MADDRVQRRLAAILAADAAGYSRLMGADEEGTLSALTAHRVELFEPAIESHGGRLIKTTGDGLLAEFASVVDAVRCALSVQQGMRDRNAGVPAESRMEFRIGINLGDVLLQDDDVYGDGVNVAARLEGLADPGGICLSRAARDQVRDRLDLRLEDLGEISVKNIARPVRAFRVAIGAPPGVGGGTADRPRFRRQLPVAAIIAFLVAAGGVWWLAPWQLGPGAPVGDVGRPPQTPKPVVAVLPFENLSGKPEENYFSDGLTEDIINALGRHRELAVMAYSAALRFKGGGKRLEDIGRTLGVRYLVEGSVRRDGDRVRVTTRLSDAAKNILLWSERFDSRGKDVFALQDAITRRIAGSLSANLARAEQSRAMTAPTSSLQSYDLVLRARAQMTRATRRGNREARRLLQRAIDLDPNYAVAYAWLGRAHYQMATDGWTEFSARALEKGEGLAQKALSIDGRTVDALLTLSRIHALRFQIEKATAELDQAIAINPSDAEARGDRGLIRLWNGDPESALTDFEYAFAFNPALRGDYVFGRGLAYYSLRRHEEAVRVLERGATRYPEYVFIRAVLVAAYGQLGRTSEARRNAEAVMRLMPIFDARRFGSRFRDKALYDYLADGLRKGGLL